MQTNLRVEKKKKLVCVLTLKHVHVDRGRRYVLRLARVIAAVRCVRVRHDEVALRAVYVHDQPPVRVEIDHPIGMVPEHEQRRLGGPLQPAYQSEAAAAHYVQVRCAEDLRSSLCNGNTITVKNAGECTRSIIVVQRGICEHEQCLFFNKTRN